MYKTFLVFAIAFVGMVLFTGPGVSGNKPLSPPETYKAIGGSKCTQCKARSIGNSKTNYLVKCTGCRLGSRTNVTKVKKITCNNGNCSMWKCDYDKRGEKEHLWCYHSTN